LLSPAPDPGASWIFVGLAQGDHVAKTPRGKKKDKGARRGRCDNMRAMEVSTCSSFGEFQ
jgi:hypothetical protein